MQGMLDPIAAQRLAAARQPRPSLIPPKPCGGGNNHAPKGPRPLMAPRRPFQHLSYVLRTLVYGPQDGTTWFPRTKWLLMSPASYIWRIPSYLCTIVGGKVTAAVYRTRLQTCKDCPSVSKRARAVGDGYTVDLFCPHCGCGERPAAELKRKNWWRRWECLEGRHPDGWGQLLPAKEDKKDDDSDDEDGDDTATAERVDNVRPVAKVAPVSETVGT